MLRTLLARAAVLALLLAPLAAQSTASDCLSGRARGAWDLPGRDHPGRVRGVLADQNGRRLALEGRLVLAPLADGRRGGFLEGVLTPITADGLAARPLGEVHGTFVVAPDRTGRFEAVVVAYSDDPRAVRQTLGKIAGAFADPLLERTDPVGRFAARWVICR